MKIELKNIKEKLKNLKPGESEFVYALAGLVFLVGLFLIIFFGWQYFSGKDFGSAIINLGDKEKEEQQENCNYRRTLDGVCVETQSEINPKLVAIMVENHLDARPQSGLVDASVVYEVPVEANYSRFMAVYPVEESVGKIGPVRSARPYFLDWVSEYDGPMYMHVGGSNEALELIDDHDIFNINEMKRGWYFWRSEDRYAPHNTYTSSKLWTKALEAYEDNYDMGGEYEGWKFVTSTQDQSNIEPQVSEVTISLLPPVYEAVWKYNTTTQQYGRYQMGYPHVDLGGRKIVADTIAIMHVEKEVLDAVGRLAIDTVSSGEASVIYNGQKIDGTWWKESRESRTKFYDNNNEEILFKPGKIWIEVVPQDGGVSYE